MKLKIGRQYYTSNGHKICLVGILTGVADCDSPLLVAFDNGRKAYMEPRKIKGPVSILERFKLWLKRSMMRS